LFIALSIAVPIVANFVRAYMIVMIGHLSGMKLAVGVDHFIYGWVFFGVVITLLFWLGSFWRDQTPYAAPRVPRLDNAAPAPATTLAAAACGAVALAAAWPLYAAQLDAAFGGPAPALASPAGAAGWSAEPEALTDWRPRYEGAAASAFQVYRKGEHRVALFLGYYRGQRQGAELVSSQNRVEAPPWLGVGSATRTERLGEGPVALRETRLRTSAQRLLVWEWYRIGERDLVDPFLAKALLARDKLLGRGDDSAVIILAAPYVARPEEAAESLRRFAREMRAPIDASLAAARTEGAK
jgi:EpsI family protein